MNKQIKISQLILENNVPTSLVTKLYNMCYRQESGLEIFTDDSNIIGNIKTGYTYDKFIELINQYFPSLQITPDGLYVSFEDELVESKIVNELMSIIYPDNNYEGVIANITTNNSGSTQQRGFRKIFKNNTEITTFNELSSLYNVKALADEEFYGCSSLTSIDLTNIESIPVNVFRKCNNLKYFNGPKSEIGTLSLPNLKSNGFSEGANQFYWDNDSSNIGRGPQVIKILDLGDCERIGDSTFYNMNTLEYIDDSVFNKLIYLGMNVFYNCENLVIENLKLPNITTIKSACFKHTQIKKISELGVCTISNNAFEECSKLTTITDEAFANITSIGNSAFRNCTNLVVDDLKMPLLTSIEPGAFSYTGIKKISNLGNAITKIIGFAYCTNLLTVNIPFSVTTIGENAFRGCTNLILPDITKYAYFESGCFAEITNLPPILYLPKVTTCIDYKAFERTNIQCIYMPAARHTRGPIGESIPTPLSNQHRGNDYRFKFGATINIIYFKNLEEVCTGVFSGRPFTDVIGYNHEKNSWISLDNIEGYYTMFNNKKLKMFNNDINHGGLPFPVNATKSNDGSSYLVEFSDVNYANIKFLIINNVNPPLTYFSYTLSGTVTNQHGLVSHGPLTIWSKNNGGTKQSFKYLVVPRAAIESYKAWSALTPNIDTTLLSSDEIDYINTNSKFDINNIIALESMPHVATKAAWDEIDPSDPHKYDYIIEEYLAEQGETVTINWDSEPTFRY